MDSCTAQAHTSLEARGNPSLKENGHALECNCMECAIIYMLLPQDVDFEDDIDLEKNSPSIVHISPRSRTSVSDCDSHKIKNSIDMDKFVPGKHSPYSPSHKIKNSIDMDKFVPGKHSPYSPPRSQYVVFKSNHVSFPENIYGVDTPLSPQQSP